MSSEPGLCGLTSNRVLCFRDNKLTMKSDNAKNRKKQRVRPYQIKKEENKKSKSKKVNNNQQEGKKNDVPEIAYGVKVCLLFL